MANYVLYGLWNQEDLDPVEIVEMSLGITLPASEAITAGAPITIIPSSTGAGQWANCDANSGTAALKTRTAIATKTVTVGAALTGMIRGILDGFDFSSQAYNARIFVSDTVGLVDWETLPARCTCRSVA